ncbi:MAG TPA: HD domain-containing phosphohydrolase [Gemmatimonadaceae bacterium]|nr:HD domain-containing phosphohydrolase [Gemmatimonadaceae bacterium]
MTDTPATTQRKSMVLDVNAVLRAGDNANVRRSGRGLIFALHAALRAIRLYPLENAAVQKALSDVAAQARDLLSLEDALEIRVAGEVIYVNATRLRLDLENFASFSHLLSLLRAAGVGCIHVQPSVQQRDWMIFLSQLQSPGPEDPAAHYDDLVGRMTQAGVSTITLDMPVEQEDSNRGGSKERAKRTYAQCVNVTKDLMTGVRLGQAPNIKKIKRVVQTIVDQILNDESSLVGLTTILDYDEYTFTHSVNVCIFSVALGKRLGLSKLQLYDLGLAALFHDIGKSRVPQDVLNKPENLSDDEWRTVANHPWLGLLALFQVRGTSELAYRAMIVSHEHHMKTDLTGYPRPIRPRQLSMFSKIVAVCDAFDAATSRRVYQTTPWTPADVVREMRDNPRRGMDPVIVKAFINLTGIYPVGTLVVLDTFELGIVHAANPITEMMSRPIVRIIGDPQGNVVYPGDLANLADTTGEGAYRRTIIKTENPERYGIRIGDYFV